ncbi:MAG: AAA domain-containing protein, partial [Myxococcota bacterium]
DRTREILLGLPGENGKGGLLSDVKVRAIECDLESVLLYKAPQSSSPITRALHEDLSLILNKTDSAPDTFSASLLARSLSSERTATEAEIAFAAHASMHGPQAKSIRTLMERLNEHDLVLLEGPPGTGKTYNIANLLIHCVATGKRLLVVSDQEAAIHALAEQLQSYVVGAKGETAEGRELEQLWRMGIKVIDELPTGVNTLSSWSRQVRRMLNVDASKELDWPSAVPGYEEALGRIDRKIQEIVQSVGQVMKDRFGQDQDGDIPSVAPRNAHPLDEASIDAVLDSAHRLTSDPASIRRIRAHAAHRERLIAFGMQDSYDLFSLDGRADVAIPRLQAVHLWLQELEEVGPVRIEDFDRLESAEPTHTLRATLRRRWLEAFPPDQGWTARAATFVRSLWGQHELHQLVIELSTIVKEQHALWQEKDDLDPELWEILAQVHHSLAPSGKKPVDVRLELVLAADEPTSEIESIQEMLEAVANLQDERDNLVRRQFLHGLGQIGRKAFEINKRGGTNRLTSILAILDRLESASSWARAADAVRELQELLFEVFPIWVSRKQAVPFLLPCREQTFDLVIVDEATQCRVDDAIPLLFRGRKLMAVGDERQTVLAKNSAIDDYLFDDFELDEHLRFAQARGMKGGGSHLFGLVKRIKQASVMLDEHYRCPPDIIEFSNRYVYGNQLRTMQWTMAGTPLAVVVSHSEANAESSERAKTGKFKGIETDMIDRFMAYVARVLRKIERDTGEQINPETDVALVYFLLKNEPYIKAVKGDLLRKLPRGSDVLDGAGAALQGKERKYIFYLWDVTRYNIGNFRQGDDETKRKGELNVLMSRPKRRAYHYLHRDFDKLKHHTCS